MSHQSARHKAIQIALEKLAEIDISQRCENLGLDKPDTKGIITLSVFGNDYVFDINKHLLVHSDTGQATRTDDFLLILHYLLCEHPVKKTQQLITFRDLPGGQFYWQPFISRTTTQLIRKIGNDLGRLKQNLNKLDWQPFQQGDLGAAIHILGRLDIVFIYYLGDEEFPANATVLFDRCIKRVYGAEDVSVLVSRVCTILAGDTK
jgi:hypothetical protein